jgi:small subunit ribosomal protein S20
MIVALLGMCYILPVRQVSQGKRSVSVPAPSKRDKQSRKRFEQNRGVETHLKNLSKNFYRALGAGDEERARQLRNESQKAYDKAATKGVIHPNKAARKVSRFDEALAGNEARSSGAPL